MKILAWPSDTGGCGYYRMWWPCAAARANGVDVTATQDTAVTAVYDPRWRGNTSDPPLGVGILALAQVPDADVVVIQRPTHWSRVRLIELLQQAGVAVVVEIDDDFTCLPKGHPGRVHWSPTLNPDKNWRWLTEACARADLVTVTTPALAARYGPHGRAMVIPNFVPRRWLTIDGKHDGGPPVVGWDGTPATHVGDLSACGTAVADTMAETGARFRAIGSAATLDELGIDGQVADWCELTDTGPAGYPATVASLDIGIAPLLDNEFNAGKSALKMEQHAALGVVTIGSPSPDNQRIHREGVGVLAATLDEWRRELTRMTRDDGWRAELAARGREAMREHCIEGNWWRWPEAWQQAIDNGRARRAA